MCLRDKILTDEGRRLGLLNRKKVQLKIKSAEDQFLARAFLLSYLPGKEKNNISKKQLESLTPRLKDKYEINIFHDHLDLLFKIN